MENIPGFDALGFRVSRDNADKLEYLLKNLWGLSTFYPALKGDCGAVSDDYFRVWTRISEEGIENVLEVPGVPGLVGTVDEYLDTDLVKAWFWDPNDTDATEPLYPLCFRSPLPWHRDAKDLPAMATSITVLAREATFFDSPEALSEHPELGRFASESVVPTGMFVEEGETPGPGILLIGKVLLAVQSKNSVTEDEFHVLRVRSLGGEFWVALPQEAISGDVNGKIVAVQGMATGSIPEAIPEALPDEPAGGDFSIDGEHVLKALRELCVRFFDSAKFQEYFADIHCDGFTRVLAGIFGIFNREARLVPKRRGKTTAKMARRYREAARNAPIVMARIVMANTMVLYNGKSSPALVVVAFGEGAEDAMDKARKVLARIHFEEPENDQERELAKQIEDETYQFGNRRRLPEWLVGGVEAYAADLWVPGIAAHEDGLRSEVLVCLAEPGIDGLTAAIPAELVASAIDSAKR